MVLDPNLFEDFFQVEAGHPSVGKTGSCFDDESDETDGEIEGAAFRLLRAVLRTVMQP